MPSKKTEPQVDEAAKNEPVEEKEPQVVKAGLCGHVNRQHYNTQGRLSELTCDLPPKHLGDHHARYMKNIGEPVTDEKGRVLKVSYHEEEAETWWNDVAGKPVADVAIGAVETLNLNQKDMIMSFMNRNPNLSAAEALKMAKSQAEWNLQEPS